MLEFEYIFTDNLKHLQKCIFIEKKNDFFTIFIYVILE